MSFVCFSASSFHSLDIIILFLNQLDDERAYAYLRIESGDELSKRAKFVFVAWVGENISGMKKAKISTDKSFVKAVIKVSALAKHLTPVLLNTSTFEFLHGI